MLRWFGFLHYSREFPVAPRILLWSRTASLCNGCLSHSWDKSTYGAMRWCLHQKRFEGAFWVQPEVSDMYTLANFLHLAFKILCFENWSDNNNSSPSPLLQCDYNFVTNWGKKKWEKQRRLTKDEARLISCLLTQNSKSFQENGIEQTARKTRTSRKSEKEESRKWTMCLVDSINIQNYYCRSFLLPGNSEIQQLQRKNVQSVYKMSEVERQPMMQTNKILYGISNRSSSRKPDSPAENHQICLLSS
jgi:hypothetical protein